MAEAPSSKRAYSAGEILEGKPVLDDLIDLCDRHNLGEHWGFTPQETAAFMRASLHALCVLRRKN